LNWVRKEGPGFTMDKKKITREARKKLQECEITWEEFEALLDPLVQKRLFDSDYSLIAHVIRNFACLEKKFKNSKSTVKKLKKLMFGPWACAYWIILRFKSKRYIRACKRAWKKACNRLGGSACTSLFASSWRIKRRRAFVQNARWENLPNLNLV